MRAGWVWRWGGAETWSAGYTDWLTGAGGLKRQTGKKCVPEKQMMERVGGNRKETTWSGAHGITGLVQYFEEMGVGEFEPSARLKSECEYKDINELQNRCLSFFASDQIGSDKLLAMNCACLLNDRKVMTGVCWRSEDWRGMNEQTDRERMQKARLILWITSYEF